MNQESASFFLPDFDQEAMDRRFVAELDRLLQEGIITSYVEAGKAISTMPSIISEIRKGRYHCNHKLLYALRQHYPAADYLWVLFGEPATGRPEVNTMPAATMGRPRLVH